LVTRGTARGPLAVSIALLLASGCAFRSFEPAGLDSVPLTGRAQVRVEGAVEVRAAVPDPAETRALFGAPLYDRGIQPVWLEVTNGQPQAGWVRFAPVGVDRFYFSPLEVAYVFRGGFSRAERAKMEAHYHALAMPRFIPAGESRSGFVFTHLAAGTKAVSVDLFGEKGDDHHFAFFIEVPGFEPDHTSVDFEGLYDASRIERLDEAGLRAALADLPCCTTGPAGDEPGPPLNLVLVAEGEDLLQALLRAGWAETVGVASPTVFDIEPHWDGRPADAVFRTQRRGRAGGGSLRLWLTPLRVGSTPVWLGQATNRVGAFLDISRLDPDVDAARNFALQSFWYGQGLARYAWLDGHYATAAAVPDWNPLADTWFSDGYRLVLWPSGPPVGLLETDYSSWDDPPMR
jgi:hypothetical protein